MAGTVRTVHTGRRFAKSEFWVDGIKLAIHTRDLRFLSHEQEDRIIMKFNITMIALGAICLAAVGSFAKDSAKPLQATLSDVPAAELPAKALELVSAAKASHRKPETVEVVKAAVAINPAAAPAIVGAIARA